MKRKADKKYGISSVFSIILRNWSVLLSFEMLYKGFGFIFLFPGLQYLLSRLPAMTGENYLGQENILVVLDHPLAVFLLFVIFLAAGGFIYFEINALTLYCQAGWRRERLTVWGIWKKSAARTISMLKPGCLPVFLLLPAMMFSFFAYASGYLRLVRIPEFIMEYLKGNWYLFIGLAAVVFIFHLLLFFYLFGFIFLMEGRSFQESWRESVRLLKGRKLYTAITLASYILIFAVVFAAAVIIGVCLLAFGADYFAQPGEAQEWFRFNYLAFQGVWNIAGGALLSAFMNAAAVVLFHRYRGDIRPKASRREWSVRRFAGRIAVIFCTITALLLFSETELGGQMFLPADMPVEIVAHRAGADLGPENTLAALEASIAEQADTAEIDVQQLRDGTLIVMHDDNFKRTTGVDLSVQKAGYEQVKVLDAGSYFSHRFEGEPIPTLEEMLKAAKGRIRLMIELKDDGFEQGMVEKTLALIKDYEMEDQCMVVSMSKKLLAQVKEYDSQMQTGYISMLLLSEQYDLGQVDAYSVETTALSKGLVFQAQLQGKKVYGWTANSEKTMEKILRCQADGIITDNPKAAARFLEREDRNLGLEIAEYLLF
ncbi:MAG: glycerophosphodiester phosphodiesterase family protein [Eubacteriales bacterium]|nr:glycerophosphodiester phosphodiesterase family protein [Eubacteriales bacterium]